MNVENIKYLDEGRMVKASFFGTTSNKQEIVLNDLEQQIVPTIKVIF